MSKMIINVCQCSNCLSVEEHPDKALHYQMNLFLSRLDEQQRRWYVGLESKKIGRGGDRLLSLITGIHVGTIRRGRRELDDFLGDRPADRVRLAKNSSNSLPHKNTK